MLALALLGLFAEHAAAADSAVAFLNKKPVITERDLADFSAAESCRGEEALVSRQASFMRLLEAEIASAALKAYRQAPSDAEVGKDAERIDRETRAPDILACIKRHFEKEPSRYLRIFVRPSLLESRLRLMLLRDPAVQERAHRLAKKALERARRGESLERAAREFGLAYSSPTFSLEASSSAVNAPGLPWSPYEADFIKTELMNLATGQLRAEPLESDYDVRLVRLLKTDGAHWTFESASAPKQGQEELFKSLKKLKLAVRDKDLRQWISGIKGNPRLFAVELVPAKP